MVRRRVRGPAPSALAGDRTRFRLGPAAILAVFALGMSCSWEAEPPVVHPAPPATSPAPALPVQLSPAAPYVPLPGEPVPEVKQLAADILQAIGTYGIGGGTIAGAEERLAGRAAPSVGHAALPLLVPGAESAVDIIYPQLSGLTQTEAGVMLVFRQRLLEDGEERSTTRVADMRFRRMPTGWIVSELPSVGGEPPEDVVTSETGRAVLDNERINLPDTARWDIEAGIVDERLLRVLLELAAAHTLDVTVFATGHPLHVFGTQRLSNHTAGRGVDIWAVDGMPVISQGEKGGPLHALVENLLTSGITELGSPWDIDGPGGRTSFTNAVHLDHLHLAFHR